MAESTPINTPVGRFVSGSLTEKRDKDINQRPIDPEKQRYEFGLAVLKNDPALPAFMQTVADAAKAGYANNPAILQRIDTWFQTMSGFSMKISDGDKPNSQGRVNENTKGHFVIWFSTSLPINCCNTQNIQIDPASIKRGWYVDIAGTVNVNTLVDHNAGIYMNPSWVRLVGEGDEIVGGISAGDAFAQAAPPAALPPGARPVGSTPQAPAAAGAPGAGMPGTPGNPAPAPAPTDPAAMPGPATMPSTAPAPTASPGSAPAYPQHHGVMQPGQPPAQPAAPAAPPAGVPGLPGMPQ